jgi:hypothetical protein
MDKTKVQITKEDIKRTNHFEKLKISQEFINLFSDRN